VLIQRRLGYQRWRVLHIGGYVAFTLLVAHVIISGPDARSAAARIPVLLAWLSTVAFRLATTRHAAQLPKRMAERTLARLQGRQVLVTVDPDKCVRFGFCEHEAPEIFQLRGDGRLTYRPSVPAAQMDQAIQAARVCPARAIMLSRAATTRIMPGHAPAQRRPREEEPSHTGSGDARWVG
jgi:ferredoxin